MKLSPEHVREYRSRQELEDLFQDYFRVEETAITSQSISVFETPYRLLTTLRLIKYNPAFTVKLDPDFVMEASFLTKLLYKIRIPILGYASIRVVAKRLPSEGSAT